MGLMTKLIKMGILGCVAYYGTEFALIMFPIPGTIQWIGVIPILPALLVMYWYWNKK